MLRVIVDKDDYDQVTIHAWTRNYNQVAYVADHGGTKVHVAIVNCRNRDHFDKTWTDGGKRFRHILGGLGISGKCIHTFKVDGANGAVELHLALYARG